MPIALQATWIAKEGEEATVLEALTQLAPLSRQEPGNLTYTVYQNPAEPTVFRIFEVYRDQTAVAEHAETAHFARWGLGVAIPRLLDRKRELFSVLDI